MGGCQNYGPFLGPGYSTARIGTPKWDPNFYNHPYDHEKPEGLRARNPRPQSLGFRV